jgi:hypothetical protein
MSAPLESNTDTAVAFLASRGTEHVLSAKRIDADGKQESFRSRAFDTATYLGQSGMRQWLDENADANIYYAVNQTVTLRGNKPALKDIATLG